MIIFFGLESGPYEAVTRRKRECSYELSLGPAIALAEGVNGVDLPKIVACPESNGRDLDV